jgi:hypothetical protein
MISNLHRLILFFVIFFLVGVQSVAFANPSINLSLSPSKAYVGETTTFTVEFTTTQNLSNAVVHFYVDAEKKGAKDLYNIERNKKYITNFDYFFNKNSHLGEHYIELEIDSITENKKKNSELFYAIVDVQDIKQKNTFVELILLCFFFILTIFCFFHNKSSKSNGTNKLWDKLHIEFSKEERKKTLFSFIIIILPISISILKLTEKTELKLGIFAILLSFITSFILVFYLFIKAEKDSEAAANNVTLYSLWFLFLGLIQMLLLVLFD